MIELQGRARWLLWALPLGQLLAVLPAAAYLWAAVRTDPTDRSSLWTLVAGLVAAVLGAWALRGQARVRTVRYLASGRLPPSEENVLKAIREVRALPSWLLASAAPMPAGTLSRTILPMISASDIPAVRTPNRPSAAAAVTAPTSHATSPSTNASIQPASRRKPAR